MKRFISFGSIDQFRTIIKNVTHTAQYLRYDEETQQVVMDRGAKMPVIKATGSEKIHGTNAAVCYSQPDGFWVQSRKNIIDAANNSDFGGGADNAGCAFTAYQNRLEWMAIITDLAITYNIDLTENIISVYFEWSGGNIQKKSALTGLDKRAMIFQYFKVSPIEQQLDNAGVEMSAKWMETTIDIASSNYVSHKEAGIYNIMDYPTVSIEIDFTEPLMSQNKMIEMVETLEKDSLVGKAFGIDGNIGEGYVFTFEYKDNIYRFKVKGEEHAKGSGKVKTLAPVDEEFENKKRTFVNEHAMKEFRLEQAWQEVFGIENEKMQPNVKATGDFLRAVINDVIKEESDIMAEMGLEPKVMNGMISKVARTWFMSALDKDAGI